MREGMRTVVEKDVIADLEGDLALARVDERVVGVAVRADLPLELIADETRPEKVRGE